MLTLGVLLQELLLSFLVRSRDDKLVLELDGRATNGGHGIFEAVG
jgi:hypothetical protein